MEVEKVRVGRINAIKLIPYSDVKKLLRYFSIRGVAREAKQEDDLANINTLQPYNNSNLTQKISSRNSLNTMVIDSMEKKALLEIDKNPNIDSDKSSIELIKAMNLARKGSKITALDLLAKSDIKNKILSKTNDINSLDKKDIKQEEMQVKNTENKNALKQKIKENNKIDKKSNEDEKKLQSKDTIKEQIPSIIEQYAKNLKELEEKKEQKNNKVI